MANGERYVLRAVAALLRADPADERTLAELGVVVGASERTLSRPFRQEAGTTFPQWRTQFRLQHARFCTHQRVRIAGSGSRKSSPITVVTSDPEDIRRVAGGRLVTAVAI